jgi:hypothetical protein
MGSYVILFINNEAGIVFKLSEIYERLILAEVSSSGIQATARNLRATRNKQPAT